MQNRDQGVGHHYAYFKNYIEELKTLFPITSDVKQMQEQWNKLMLLYLLGSLPSEYTLAQPGDKDLRVQIFARDI